VRTEPGKIHFRPPNHLTKSAGNLQSAKLERRAPVEAFYSCHCVGGFINYFVVVVVVVVVVVLLFMKHHV
jgi:hypothetical protein